MKQILNILRKLRTGLLHATYHRNMKQAELARKSQDIIAFKKYIYQAEDAWRKIVIINNKSKTNG
jgi:hypothetical protein